MTRTSVTDHPGERHAWFTEQQTGHRWCHLCGIHDPMSEEDTVSRPDPRVPVSADNVVRVMQREIDRLRAIEYEAEAWHDAIRRGDFGPSTCACNRMDGTRCSLGAALEGAPE